MKVKIHELAVKEFDEAIEYYNIQYYGLGNRFKKSVIEQIRKIKLNPLWFPIEKDNVFKSYNPKFPFKILFSVENNSQINIWAISHLHREPFYWQSRIN